MVTLNDAVPAPIKKDVAFLTHHLILTGVILGAITLGAWGVQAMMAKAHKEQADESRLELAVVVDQVKRLEEKQASDDAATQQREAAANALIQSLIAAVNARDKALDDQIKKNGSLSAQEAAARLSQQYNAQPGEIVASGNTVIANLPMSRNFVSTFDTLVVCKADLGDTQKQLSAEQGKETDLKTQISDRDNTIKGKDVELEKQKKADGDDKKVAVDNEKKKHKWYAIGGVVLIEAVKFYLTGKP